MAALSQPSQIAKRITLIIHFANVWAQIMLVICELPLVDMPCNATDVIRTHVHHCTSAEQLQDHVWECQLVRTWAGTATIWKLSTSTDLQPVASAADRILVCSGAHMKYGPAPRGPLERATASALQAHVRSVKG